MLQPDLLGLESLLSEETWSGVSLDVSAEPLDHFPCIADELEEQAKQLEEDWFLPNQPPAAAAAVAKAQQSFRPNASAAALGPPALRHSALEALQQQLALQAEQARQQQQQQRAARQQDRAALAAEEEQGEATVRSSGGEEPCTPQRNSRGDSCWSESPLPGSSLDDYAEVQSPAPAKLMSLPSPAGPHNTCPPPPSLAGAARCLPPLALAIDNAQRVRLGQEPTPGAWRGCARSPLCSLAPLHRRPDCDAAAVLPGLLAYSHGELFESGVNIEELCRVPAELLGVEGALAFKEAEVEGEGAADCLSSGHKRARPEGEEAQDDGASHSQSGCGGCGGSTSSSSPAEVSQRQQQQQAAAVAAATAVVKRMRTDASSASTLAAFPLAAVTGAVLQPSPAAVAMAVAEAAAAACPRMVPVEVLAPLHLLAPPVPLPLPSLGSAVARNRGRPAGAPRLRPLLRVETPPPPPPAPVAHTPSKPVTRQKQHNTPVAVAPVAPRTSGRKAVLQWHTESVTDPRTGASVSEVHPGTFCTQCYALSTPVWRAGPFGHKTLCNACGVRWMKASKGSKK